MNIFKPSIPVMLAWAAASLAHQPALAAIPASDASTLPCGGSVTVEPGDSLAGIAAQCGVSVTGILAVNPEISDPERISSGQRLYLPSSEPDTILAADELEEILAPVALYPDPLLAEMLPAATYPLEIVQADRFVKSGHGPEEAEAEDWAPSVKALTHYPEVLDRMAADLDWTIALGDAFLTQPDDVFASIQSLRARANTAGNLRSDEHHVVVEEPVELNEVIEVVEPPIERTTVIRIVPAYRERIYVPYYDPFWVYQPYGLSHHYYGRALFHFSAGYALGGWLTHYLDWHHHRVWIYPVHYRQPFYYHSPHLRLHRDAWRWSPWYHQPMHRRGYRYQAPPRVRVDEGQRRYIVYSNRTRHAGPAVGDRDARPSREQVIENLSRRREVRRQPDGPTRRYSTSSGSTSLLAPPPGTPEPAGTAQRGRRDATASRRPLTANQASTSASERDDDVRRRALARFRANGGSAGAAVPADAQASGPKLAAPSIPAAVTARHRGVDTRSRAPAHQPTLRQGQATAPARATAIRREWPGVRREAPPTGRSVPVTGQSAPVRSSARTNTTVVRSVAAPPRPAPQTTNAAPAKQHPSRADSDRRAASRDRR